MHPRSALPRALPATLLFLVAACGGGSETTSPTPVVTQQFTATIDGAPWESLTPTAAATSTGTFTLAGLASATGTAISVTLAGISAAGTYPLGVGPSVAGGSATVTNGSSSWGTPLSGAAGTVTITTITTSRITGSFTFAAPPLPGQSQTNTRNVTNGQFSIPVTGASTFTIPDDAASKVTGTAAGTTFNAATVTTNTSPTSGTLTFSASNTAQTLSLILTEYTAPGPYTLGTGTSHTLRLTNTGANAGTWGGTNALSAGTVTITSETASRVKGTLNATLQPAPGTTGAAVTVTLTFEVGISLQ